MNQSEFEDKWWHKIVVPRLDGAFSSIPIKHYVVTAALWEYNEDKSSVMALFALDYTLENPNWFTFYVPADKFDEYLLGLEIIDTPEANELGRTYVNIVERIIDEIQKQKEK